MDGDVGMSHTSRQIPFTHRLNPKLSGRKASQNGIWGTVIRQRLKACGE